MPTSARSCMKACELAVSAGGGVLGCYPRLNAPTVKVRTFQGAAVCGLEALN